MTHFQEYWRENVQDKWALVIVQKGYAIESERDPPTASGIRETHYCGPESDTLLRDKIDLLLKKNAIEIVPQEDKHFWFYSQLFLVPKRDGSLRPVFNLRPLNEYI